MVSTRNMYSNILQVIDETLSLTAALICGILAYSKMDRASRFLFYQLCAWVLFFTAGYLVTSLQPVGQQNNQFVYNISLMCETILLLFAVNFIFNSRVARYLLMLAYGLFFCVYFYQWSSQGFLIYFDKADLFASFLFTITCSIVLFYILRGEKAFLNPLFWIFIGLLIYYACSIPYLSFFTILEKNNSQLSSAIYHIINDNLANIRYVLLAVGFWLYYRTSSSIKITN